MSLDDARKNFDKMVEDFNRDEHYKPPIEIYQTIEQVNKDFIENQEKQIMLQVNQYVDVDKEELIKALKYDRDQYHKGFEDGAREALRELKVYKKALEIACWDTMCNCLHDDYYNDLLQKAREQNE